MSDLKDKLKLVTVLFFVCFLWEGASWAQNAPTAQIQRSQEMVEKERLLREEIKKNEKVLIKKIIVQGSPLSKDRIEEIIDPFKNHWLSKEDIDSLVASIRDACIKNAPKGASLKVSHQVYKNTLKIIIEK